MTTMNNLHNNPLAGVGTTRTSFADLRHQALCNASLSDGLDLSSLNKISSIRVPGGAYYLTLPSASDYPTMRGPFTPPSDRTFVAVAERLLTFHADAEKCLPANCPKLGNVVAELIQYEKKLLEKHFQANRLELDRKLSGSFLDAISAVVSSSEVINKQAMLLGEPVMGHGAVKCENIVADSDGKVYIVRPSTDEKAYVLPRRMDAQLLRTELEIHGLELSAQAYWKTYSIGYERHFMKGEWSDSDRQQILRSLEVTDLAGQFYGASHFYRLSLQGQYPEHQMAAQSSMLMAAKALNKLLING